MSPTPLALPILLPLPCPTPHLLHRKATSKGEECFEVSSLNVLFNVSSFSHLDKFILQRTQCLLKSQLSFTPLAGDDFHREGASH